MAADPQAIPSLTGSSRPSIVRHAAVAADRDWRDLTERANRAYAANDLPDALELYHRALDEAERLFALASDSVLSIPAPVIYNVSCHNLAELAQRCGNARLAERFLERAYDKLLQTAESASTPLQLRLDCMQHLQRALVLLAEDIARRGDPGEKIPVYVDRAKKAAFHVVHVAKHAELARLDCDHCPIVAS